MNTNELRAWAEQNAIENKTIDSFWFYINSYEEEVDEPFFDMSIDKNELQFNLNGLGLFIDAWNKNSCFQYGFDYVISYLTVLHKGEHLGEYKLFFKLNGDIFDETFISVTVSYWTPSVSRSKRLP